MLRLLWLLVAQLSEICAAQDPASMATAMAGQVAGIVASKAEQAVEPWRVRYSNVFCVVIFYV